MAVKRTDIRTLLSQYWRLYDPTAFYSIRNIDRWFRNHSRACRTSELFVRCLSCNFVSLPILSLCLWERKLWKFSRKFRTLFLWSVIWGKWKVLYLLLLCLNHPVSYSELVFHFLFPDLLSIKLVSHLATSGLFKLQWMCLSLFVVLLGYIRFTSAVLAVCVCVCHSHACRQVWCDTKCFRSFCFQIPSLHYTVQ